MTLVGFLASTSVMLAMGRSRVPVGMIFPPSFWGMLSPSGSGGGFTAAIAIVGVAVLVACWWWLLGEVAAGRLPMRVTAWTVAGWAAPLLLGPPLLSFDAFAYLAQGDMVARGLDPYAAGPVALGGDPLVDQVDPMWRSSPSPYGPVALVALRAVAMLDAGLTTSVLALRLLAVIGVLTATAAAILLSQPQRRPLVLALTLANPVTLLHLVGGAHVDAVLAGLVLLSLLALKSDREWSALLLAGVAVAFKITTLPLFLLIVVVAVRRRGIRALWFSLVALLLPFLLSGSVLARPWGFIGALTVPGKSASWYAPASLIGELLQVVAALVGLPVSEHTSDLVGRALVLLGGAATVIAVLYTAWRDERPDTFERTIARAGMILLTVALVLPALYGWYLGPALFVVAAAGNPHVRRAAVVLCSLLTFSSLPSMYDTSPWLVAAAWVVALGLLAASALLHRPHLASGTRSPDDDRGNALSTGPRTASSRGARDPAVRATASKGAHRRLLAMTRIAELTVLPVLGLALAVPGASPLAPAETAARARLESHVKDIARVTDEVEAAYPGYQIAHVLPRPEEVSGAQDFQIELVRPGRWPCWLWSRLPKAGPVERLADAISADSRIKGCPRPPAAGDGMTEAGDAPRVEGG